MRMTPAMLIIGATLIYWASISIMIAMPVLTWKVEPSEIWQPLSPEAQEGLGLYVDNGCSYCHSLYVRPNDWGIGAYRIAEAGDYAGYVPIILGTERTGPDLSQEGGLHPDDWHLAHFTNPRYTSPRSVMPSWEFLGPEKIARLTTYVQSLGGKMAAARVARQEHWKQPAVAAYLADPDSNIAWLHEQVPDVWRPMPNPYPVDDGVYLRGKWLYQYWCIGCHGPIGDGNGPAAPFLMPPPLNFTTLRRHLVDDRYIGGIFYYQIMNGITGTAMPYFKHALESEKIWDLSNYLAVSFLGYTDADLPPEGIDASYEQPWLNPYQPPLPPTGTAPLPPAPPVPPVLPGEEPRR